MHDVKLDSNLIPIWNLIAFSLNFTYYYYIYRLVSSFLDLGFVWLVVLGAEKCIFKTQNSIFLQQLLITFLQILILNPKHHFSTTYLNAPLVWLVGFFKKKKKRENHILRWTLQKKNLTTIYRCRSYS